MTFSYAGDLTSDSDFVRWHCGDTVEVESLISDEEITFLLIVAESKEAAAIQALEYKITRLSQPKFQADWLTVDPATAISGLRAMLAEKRKELGVYTSIPATGETHVYRADSQMTAEPDYSEGI